MKVDTKIIQALSLFAGKDDIRYYLNAINFELHPDKTILTATNGATMLIVCLNEPNETTDTFMIPTSAFLKSKIDYEISRSDSEIVMVTTGVTKTAVHQDSAKYPDFRRVVPTKPADKVEHKTYDPDLLLNFKKASKLLGGLVLPVVHPNDIVDIGLSNVIGVIAPVKLQDNAIFNVAPAWLK